MVALSPTPTATRTRSRTPDAKATPAAPRPAVSYGLAVDAPDRARPGRPCWLCSVDDGQPIVFGTRREAREAARSTEGDGFPPVRVAPIGRARLLARPAMPTPAAPAPASPAIR